MTADWIKRLVCRVFGHAEVFGWNDDTKQAYCTRCRTWRP